jgi:hypothetical protein
MDLQRLKDLAFRHGEKVILAAILLFVVLNVYSNLTDEEGVATGERIPVKPQKRTVSRGIQPQTEATVAPFIHVPQPVVPPYDPTVPPTVFRLGVAAAPGCVELQIPSKSDTEKNDTALLQAPGKIVGTPKEAKPTPEDIQGVAPGLLEQKDLCEVEVTVKRETSQIELKAVKAGRPRAYEGDLASKDGYRFSIVIAPEKYVRPVEYGKAVIQEIGEQKLGIVTLRILEPARAEELDKQKPLVKHIDPTAYVIWRRAEGEKEPKKLTRIAAFKTAGPKPAQPAGEPSKAHSAGSPADFERKRATPKGEQPRVPGPAGPQRNEFPYEDRGVDSGVTYYYSVESFVEDEEGKPVKGSVEWDKDRKYTTLERFSVVYTGGTASEAKITVLIGTREKPQGSEIFKVRIGERIGETAAPPRPIPHKGLKKPLKGAEPAEAKKPAAEEGEEGIPNRFATGFILVDILPDAYNLVEQRRPESVTDAQGKREVREVKTYWSEYRRQIVVRERKGRLVTYWLELFEGKAPVKGPEKEKEPVK